MDRITHSCNGVRIQTEIFAFKRSFDLIKGEIRKEIIWKFLEKHGQR